MTWARTGTVTLTNGSTNVVGVGTKFLSELRDGDGLRGADGQIYEVLSRGSDVQLSLAFPYLGATVNGTVCRILPIDGYNQKSADDLRAFTRTAGLMIDSPAIQAVQSLNMVPNGVPYMSSAAAMATALSTQFGRGLWGLAGAPALRAAAELGTAALANIQTTPTDTTPLQAMIVGAFGLGGGAIELSGGHDLNSARPTGFYYVSNISNRPPGAYSGYGFLIHISLTSNNVFQVFWPYNRPEEMWVRNKDSAWGNWVCLSSIGVGQTYRDLTSSRALSTDYTNTTGRTTMVQMWGGPASAANTTYICRVAGAAICRANYAAAGTYLAVPGFVVQPGQSYSIAAANGSAPLSQWVELII